MAHENDHDHPTKPPCRCKIVAKITTKQLLGLDTWHVTIDWHFGTIAVFFIPIKSLIHHKETNLSYLAELVSSRSTVRPPRMN